MKKIVLTILLSTIALSVFSQSTYYEKKFSFNSTRTLAFGNTFTAQSNGLESFEYNPAGLTEDGDLTLFNTNFSLISNFVQISKDLVADYNSVYGTDKSFIEYSDISYFLTEEYRPKLIKVLLDQASKPYQDGKYANGLGFGTSLSFGYAGNGIGLGFILGLDSEVFGEDITDTQLNNIVTASLLLGYGLSIDLDIIGVDVGIGLRPMYKIRTSSSLKPVVDLLSQPESPDFITSLSYKTGIGMGIDVGAKAHFMGLTVGLSIIDLFGTNVVYTENSYENIYNGVFLGDATLLDKYITPATLKIGLAYNPDLGLISGIINPTLALDYNLMFVENGTLEDYKNQGNFWTNLSIGAELELLSFVNLRCGLNQGYVTVGAGARILFFDLSFAVYSKELGAEVGDRQQMGASIEFGVKL